MNVQRLHVLGRKCLRVQFLGWKLFFLEHISNFFFRSASTCGTFTAFKVILNIIITDNLVVASIKLHLAVLKPFILVHVNHSANALKSDRLCGFILLVLKLIVVLDLLPSLSGVKVNVVDVLLEVNLVLRSRYELLLSLTQIYHIFLVIDICKALRFVQRRVVAVWGRFVVPAFALTNLHGPFWRGSSSESIHEVVCLGLVLWSYLTDKVVPHSRRLSCPHEVVLFWYQRFRLNCVKTSRLKRSCIFKANGKGCEWVSYILFLTRRMHGRFFPFHSSQTVWLGVVCDFGRWS